MTGMYTNRSKNGKSQKSFSIDSRADTFQNGLFIPHNNPLVLYLYFIKDKTKTEMFSSQPKVTLCPG